MMVRTSAEESEEVVPVDPSGDILLYIGGGSVPGDQVRGLIVSETVDREDVAKRLRRDAQVSYSIARISDRLRVDPEQMLSALGEITADTPARNQPVDTQLSGRDLEVLAEAGVVAEADPQSVARSAARAAVQYARLVSDSHSVSDVAHILRVSEARVRQRIAKRTLYAFQGPKGWLLPAFQFAPYGALQGLDLVVEALPQRLHPISVEGFFVRPNADLDRGDGAMSVVDWLASGGPPEPAAELAGDLLVSS